MAFESKPVRVLERRGRGGWVPGRWIGTVERGKKKGWYKVSFVTPTRGALVFEGRRRKTTVTVRPDQVRLDNHHSRREW